MYHESGSTGVNAKQFYSRLYSLLLLLIDNFEFNQGVKRNSSAAFSIFRWNLNSVSRGNYAKKFLLKSYTAIQKLNNTGISETYPDSNTPDDNYLNISGHNLVCSDHPSTNKRSGACIQRCFPFRNPQCPIFKWKHLFWT